MTESTDPGNNANYYRLSTVFLIGSPYYRTIAGEFELSDSPYGTFDQGGNVWEWNEAVRTSPFPTRGLRGGSYDYNESQLLSLTRDFQDPTLEVYRWGFRVASVAVPEPSTLLLLCFGSLTMLWRRRKL